MIPVLFKQLACKPDSVRFCFCKRSKTGFHHLSGHNITAVLIRPTPRHRTSSPVSPVYMVFQPIRCTAPDVATRTGELLPHLFTLTRALATDPQDGGYFLLHYYTLTDIFPLGSMVLCVARTFLTRLRNREVNLKVCLSEVEGRHDGTACCPAKIIKSPGLRYSI